MDDDKSIAIAVLGILAVLAIIGLVLMFTQAGAVGRAFGGVGQFGVYTSGESIPRAQQYFQREWQPSYADRVSGVRESSSGREYIAGDYGRGRYGGIVTTN